MGGMYALSEILRRFEDLFFTGTVTAVDGITATVSFGGGENQSAPCRWLVSRAGFDSVWYAPSIGEQVLCAAPAGDTAAQAIIIGSLYQDTFPAPSTDPGISRLQFKDGSSIQYDQGAQALQINLESSATIQVTAAGGAAWHGDFDLNGDLNITGSVTASGDVSDKSASMAADREAYNSHGHTPTATTPPKQQMG